MVTFLVCLVVVGGAMAAIIVLTMGEAADQPATEDPVTDRVGPLRNVGVRAASYLVPSGPPAQSRPRTAAEAVDVAAAPEPEPAVEAVEPAGAVDLDADPAPAPAPPGAGDVTALVTSSPPAAPPQDGPTLEIEEDPTATMAVPLAGALAQGDDTIAMRVADPRAEPASDADATAVPDRSAADQTMAMPVPGAAHARAEGAPGPLLRRTLVDDPARHADAAARSRSWRALRRLRGMALLVVMMVGLGTLLAVTLAGLVALVAIGVRTALGT